MSVSPKTPPRPSHRVVVVDDLPMYCMSIASLLKNSPDLSYAGAAHAPNEAFDLIKKVRPQVLLAGLRLRTGSGPSFIKEVMARFPTLKVLVLADVAGKAYVTRLLRAGTSGYVDRGASVEETVRALRTVAAGGLYLPPDHRDCVIFGLLPNAPQAGVDLIDALSDRELEVLACYGRGLTTLAIAEELSLSHKTVDCHRAALLKKLNLPNARALRQFAINWWGNVPV